MNSLFEKMYNDPLFHLGAGLLAGQNIGQGVQQGLLSYQNNRRANQLMQYDQMRMAEMQRQAQQEREKQRRAQEQAAMRQQVIAQRYPDLAGLPQSWQDKAFEAQLEGPDRTNIENMLIAGGLRPGTPEFQKAVLQYALQPKAPSIDFSPTVQFPDKAADSLANQVGPLLKTSRDQVQSGLRMFDAANRIDSAIASGNVNVGPGATVKQYLSQLAAVAGVDNKRVVNTRQVIQALADTAVEARTRLAGQGQVTENEALAVEKAASGQYEALTIGELQLLANLNRKAAKLVAEQHQYMLQALPEELQAIKPFYEVKGSDRLLQYQAPGGAAPAGGASPAERARAELQRREAARRQNGN